MELMFNPWTTSLMRVLQVTRIPLLYIKLSRKVKWQHADPKTCRMAAVLLAVASLTALLMYLIFVPMISRDFITESLKLQSDSEALKLWQRRPASLFTRVYLWNLTNAAQVSAGLESPSFVEIGPYVYEHYTEKFPSELKLNSIVYQSRKVYKFCKNLTYPASLDDVVVTLNAGLYGAASLVQSLMPSMMSVVSAAAPVLFPGLDSVFSSVRVGDFLFDGITLHCAEAAGTKAALVCSLLPGLAPPNIRPLHNTSDFAYSFLAHKNNTLQGLYEENRGLKDIHELGHLLSIKGAPRTVSASTLEHCYCEFLGSQVLKKAGSKQLNIWEDGSLCDQLRGTDSLTFSPFVEKTDIVNIYSDDICQVVPLHFESVSHLRGLEVYKFSLLSQWLANATNNPPNSCYCSLGHQLCHKNGLRDISKCMKVPVLMSLPHFLLADEDLRIYAQGMRPEKELHSSHLYIEPQTGAPIKAAKRVQFNMFLRKIDGFELVQNVSEGVFPLLWLEEVLELPEDVLDLVRSPLLVQWVISTLCWLLAALLLIVLCCVLVSLCSFSCHKPPNQVTTLSTQPIERRPPQPTLTLANKLYPHPS